VAQHAADDVLFEGRGDLTIEFEGSTLVSLLGNETHSGAYQWWALRGDEGNATLTRAFDLSALNRATLQAWTWYDLEVDYDYVFLETSVDGETWNIIVTPSGTGDNPSGNSYGWGYNARSNGWIQETIDISQYAGKKVWFRFEYVTDAMVNGNGLFLDDMAIPEIGYATDFENDDGGWLAEGFVLIDNMIPQTFLVSIIDTSGQKPVQKYSLDAGEDLSLTLDAHPFGQEYIIVVSGSSRFTRQEASYQIVLR